jgi:hypothetical protein
MVHKRNDQRITYISKCLLEVHDASFAGLLENVSAAGASIEISGAMPQTVQDGDSCNLTALLLGPVKLPCKVLRITSTSIAVQFLDK